MWWRTVKTRSPLIFPSLVMLIDPLQSSKPLTDAAKTILQTFCCNDAGMHSYMHGSMLPPTTWYIDLLKKTYVYFCCQHCHYCKGVCRGTHCASHVCFLKASKDLACTFPDPNLLYLPRISVKHIAKLDSANPTCRYGMLDPSNKDSNDLPLTIRAVFIIGPDKKLKLSLNYPASVGRNMDEIMRCVDALQLSAKHSVVSLPLCIPDVSLLPLLLPLPFSSPGFPIFSLCISLSVIAYFSGTALCPVLLTSRMPVSRCIHCS